MIEDELKYKQIKYKKTKDKLTYQINIRQKWVNYFSQKQQKTLKICKNFLLNSVAYLILGLCSALLSKMMLVASAFVGLSVGCFIVFGYQRIIVYRKFSKVIKATQKNLDACIENKSKLIKLEKEIESQLETLNKISQQSELTNIPVTKTLKDSNLTIDNTRNDLNI